MTVTEAYPLEAADPDCIDDAAAVDLLRDAPWRRLVVLGDSVAAGVREPAEGYRDECFANRVGQALTAAHEDAAYVNLGVRELRLAQIRDTQLPAALEFAPDLAMVIGGGNDAISRRYDPERVREELRQIVVPLAEAGAFIATIGLFDLARSGLVPPEHAPAMTERFDELDAVTAEVAAEVGGFHVDTHHHPRAADPAIFASDLMHANTRGHAIAFAAIVHALSALDFGRTGRALDR
jgi:lysophospholipase L1-like esterase